MGTRESLLSEYGFVLCCEKTIYRSRSKLRELSIWLFLVRLALYLAIVMGKLWFPLINQPDIRISLC